MVNLVKVSPKGSFGLLILDEVLTNCNRPRGAASLIVKKRHHIKQKPERRFLK